MSKTMKKVSALLLAFLMIVTYMPMLQEDTFAAKAKKPAKVKGLKVKVAKNKRKITVTWKKAKRAKKYAVQIKDKKTKLASTKTTKKRKLVFSGQWSTSYQIRVRGINGKKKGKWSVKRTAKVGQDPALTKALREAKENKQMAERLLDALAAVSEELEKLKEAKEADAQTIEDVKDAIEKAQEIINAYENLSPEEQANVPQSLKDAIVDAKDAIQEANAAVQDAVIRNAKELRHRDWNPEVKDALNDLIRANKNQGKYVVFDFDNTCSIFDVEEQLAIYQLQTMAFDETVDAEKLADILKTELNPDYFTEPASASGDYCENANATYQDWIDDITAAFQKLVDKGYKFTPEGLSEADQARIQADDDWKEFATKMRAMYDCVFDSESAAVAYPWVLYWFTGMTEEEVYQLAKRSHSFYKEENSRYETWHTPDSTAGEGSKIGAIGSRTGGVFSPSGYEFTWGTQVSENIRELWAALDNNGIDVWVCSASATDPIRAAVDVWGGHDHIKGVMAMTNKLDEDGKYINEYDWTGGNAWLCKPNGDWVKDDKLQKTQTQGKGKVIAIQNVLYPKYHNEGPIAGFMDSTGDFNFCTEFADLQVVCCFNRASRKVTDGGGVIAELALYQADELGYDYSEARANGDTLYVLQGREENGLRGFRPERATLRLGKTTPQIFRDDGNWRQLQDMVDNNMTTQQVIDTFAIKTAADDPNNPYGYKYGFVTGKPGQGLGPKFHDDTWNPDDLDFSGYHSQGEADEITLLKHKDWNPEVRKALNSMILDADNAWSGKYVVFDFDNTCSIFDVEEQLAIYQLQTMAFDETVDAEKLADILKTELNPDYFTAPASASGDYCENANATYQDWIDDITAAFQKLLDKGYKFTPAGLNAADQAAIQADDDWKEFATKMRAMYDCVFDSESAAVAYPWVLYWFTGMSEEEVYQLAKRSHSFYKEEESRYETWHTPDSTAGEGSKIGAIGSRTGGVFSPSGYEFTWGTAVSENIVELWKALDENGIDVWICSASATDPIRAAIDVWGGHEYITGMMAMTNKLDANGKYINEYDWTGGNAWLCQADGKWKKDTEELQKTQTQGKGKVIAIQNVLYPKYGNEGPIAGFMDSTGDFNFCTEFKTLQVVACFNRASRKVTDGGGVIAELACYQADTLGYNYAKAKAAGDTLYVLQGREENGLRGFRPERATLRLGKTTPQVFRDGGNEIQLMDMMNNDMTTQQVIDTFAIKTGTPNPYGYKYGFVYGQPGQGLGPKFHDDTWNPDDLDFSGYHTQA